MSGILEAKRTLGLENVPSESISEGVLALAYEYQRSVAAANNDEASVNEVCKARSVIENYRYGGYFPPKKEHASKKAQIEQRSYSAKELEFYSSGGISAGLKTALATHEWVAMIIAIVLMLPTLSSGVPGLLYFIAFLCAKVVFLDCIYLPYRFKRRLWGYSTSGSMESLPKVQNYERFNVLGGNGAFDTGNVLQLLSPWKRGIVIGLSGIAPAMLVESIMRMSIMEAVEVGLIIALIVFLTRYARSNVDWNDALKKAMDRVAGPRNLGESAVLSTNAQTSANGSNDAVYNENVLHLPMGTRSLLSPLFPKALTELSAGRSQMAIQVLACVVAGQREVVPTYRTVSEGLVSMFKAAFEEFSSPGASVAFVNVQSPQTAQVGQDVSSAQNQFAQPVTGDACGLLCSALGLDQTSANTLIESEFFKKAGLSYAGNIHEKLKKGAAAFEQSFPTIDQATRERLHVGDATALMPVVLRDVSSSSTAFVDAACFLCWLVYSEFGQSFRDSCNRKWIFSAIVDEHSLHDAIFTMGEQAKAALKAGLANLKEIESTEQAQRNDESSLRVSNSMLEDAKRFSNKALYEEESTRLQSSIAHEESKARSSQSTAWSYEEPLKEAESKLRDVEQRMDTELDRLADIIDGYVDGYNDTVEEIDNLEYRIEEMNKDIEEMDEWVSTGSYEEEDSTRNEIQYYRDEIAEAEEKLERELAEIDERYADLDPNSYNGFQNIGRENRAGSQRYRAQNEYDRKVSAAQRKLDELETKLSEISSQRVSWATETRRLSSQLSDAEIELDHLYNTLNSTQAEIDRAERENDRVEAMYKPMVEEHRANRDSLSGKIAQASRSAAAHRKEAESLQSRLDTITHYFEGGPGLIADYENKVAQIESKIDERSKVLDSLNKRNDELHAEFLQAFTSDIEGYEEKAEELREAVGTYIAKDVFGMPFEFFTKADSVMLLTQSPRFFAKLHEALYRELLDSPTGAQIKASVRWMKLPFASIACECREGGFASVFSVKKKGALNDACAWLVEQAEGSGELPLTVARSTERTLLLQKGEKGWSLQLT